MRTNDHRTPVVYSRQSSRFGFLRHDEGGFTLIELLVVIAVIAILASLLLPALSRAKQAVDNTVCVNNLRQQAIGLMLYVSDFGAYPLSVTPKPWTATSPRLEWMQFLEPYVGDKWPGYNGAKNRKGVGVFACPRYTKIGGIYKGNTGAYAYTVTGGGRARDTILKFDVKVSGLSDGNEFISAPPVKESQVITPSQMIALGDSPIDSPIGVPSDQLWGIPRMPFFWSFLIASYAGVDYPNASQVQLLPTVEAMLKRRHNGYWNMAFCDGHVQHGKHRTFFDIRNDEVAKLWNRDGDPRPRQ